MLRGSHTPQRRSTTAEHMVGSTDSFPQVDGANVASHVKNIHLSSLFPLSFLSVAAVGESNEGAATGHIDNAEPNMLGLHSIC